MRRSLIDGTRREIIPASIAATIAVAMVAVALVGCAHTPSPRDPLAPSDPPERVLRTLRLAGVENAVVGERRGTAVVRIEVSGISSAGDVEIAWQLGATALADAYPRARTYAVQLYGSGAVPLVEFALGGRDARQAIEDDDPAALRAGADVRYLFTPGDSAGTLRDSEAAGARPMPRGALATDAEVTGAYLDAKNRAVGLSGDAGGIAARATAAAERTRLAVPGRPAPGPDEDTGLALSLRLTELLDAPASTVGHQAQSVRPLREYVASVRADADPESVLGLRTWFAVVEAVVAEKPFGTVIAPVRDSARAVATARIPDRNSPYRGGRQAEAVLVAARSPEAPESMKVVTGFIHGERYDISASAAGTSTEPTTPPADESVVASAAAAPREALARLARDATEGGLPAVSWETTAGVREQVAPLNWLAYLRSDGRMFWLAGENGPVALTDASLTGWAWSARRAAVVDARDVGVVLSTIDLR